MDIDSFLMSLSEWVLTRRETDLQIVCKYFNPTTQKQIRKFIRRRVEHGKDANKSKSLRQAGNEHYAKDDYVTAMIRYNESIEFAPDDSLEYATALANRSTVLFQLQRYKDCLVDINRVLASKYPTLLKYKVYIRQAKCLLELKHYGTLQEVVHNFKQWLENERTNLSKEKIDHIVESINEIEQSLTDNCENMDIDEPESTLPVVTGGENPKFAYASKSVIYKKNAQGVGGKHVMSNTDIKKGDILFVEEPYSTSCTSTHFGYFTYCNHCFASSLTCIPCKYCTEIYFCTEQCRDDYWNLRHKWECLAIRKRLLSPEYSLALGIFFRASRTGFKTAAKNDNVYGNKEDNYPFVNQLLTHKTEISVSRLVYKAKEVAMLVVYLTEFTDFIDWLYAQENRLEVSRDTVYKVIGKILLKILLQVGPNSETVLHSFVMYEDKFSPGLNYHTVALGLYVSSCLMNHSCLPNAIRSFHGSTKVVRALTDIKKGTEITICYLRDPDMNSQKGRQSLLLEKYLFLCACPACTSSAWLYPWLCVQCHGPALSTSNGRTAHCLECQHSFSLELYVERETKAHMYRGIYQLYDMGPHNLELCVNIMRNVYHKNNYKFMFWYSLIVESSDNVGDFEKSLAYVNEMVRLLRAVFGENAGIGNLNMELKRCNCLVNYCLSLDDPTTENYKIALNNAKDGIDNCCDMLKYHMCNKIVDCYKENMLNILSAGDLDYDTTVQQYHYNSIPFGVNVRVADQPYIPNTEYYSFKR